MPLGLLAKDSIADLEACAARAEAASSDSPSGDRDNESFGVVSASHDNDDEVMELAVHANPQQAQEDDRAVSHPTTRNSRLYKGGRWFPDSAVSPTSSRSSSRRASSSTYYSAGFELYEKDHHDYYHDSYSSMFIGEKRMEQRGLLDCIFPCLRPPPDEEYESQLLGAADTTISSKDVEATESSNQEGEDSSLRGAPSSSSKEDDEVSTNSDVLGERLSDKERQAVLARLRLAQPDATEMNSSTQPFTMAETEEVKTTDGGSVSRIARSALSQKGLLNGIPAYDTSPLLSQDPASLNRPLKGILKRYSFAGKDKASTQLPQGASAEGKPVQRRSLFPSYETVKPRKPHINNVTFAPMARVVTVKSKNEMTPEEKAAVWFQKSDYEDFRKTGRIITKAMLEGGSEIWLTSSLRSTDNKFNGHKNGTSSSGPGVGSASASGHGENKENPSHKAPSAPGNKWWHKFGHSRRGLEHIVSFDEGRQRQSNVRNAIHAVLEEQARQRRYRREDSEKLRTVALHHTSWARDLALAAGASDADAVRSSFAEDRKSREFFLLKLARSESATVTNSCRVPEFMQPALHAPMVASPRPVTAVKAQRLDENTAAQLRYRHEQESALARADSSTEESSEPIRDPNPEDRKQDSMAQRAKGFISDGAGRVDMSAVLSGLGAVTQDATAAVASA